MTRQIKKVHVKFDDARHFKSIHIDYAQENSQSGKDDYLSLSSNETPEPELLYGLQNLAAVVRQICDLPAHWDIFVRGITLKEDGQGNEKVIISATRSLPESTPLVINTPMRYIASELGQYDLTSEQADLIERLETHVEAYLDGHRAQGELKLDYELVDVEERAGGLEEDEDGDAEELSFTEAMNAKKAKKA